MIGNGNSCCGDIPFDKNGDKICLCGALYNRLVCLTSNKYIIPMIVAYPVGKIATG